MDFDSLNITNLDIAALATGTLRVQRLDLRQLDFGGTVATFCFAALLTLVLLLHAGQSVFAISYYCRKAQERSSRPKSSSYQVFDGGQDD
jgi:hypothetical protein